MKKISYLFLVFILIFSQAQLLSAFESHIISVTATIMRDPGGKTSLDISKTVDSVCHHKCGENRRSYAISGQIFITNTGENPALVSEVSDIVWYKLNGDNPWQEATSSISTNVPSIIPVNDGSIQEFSYSGTFELLKGISPDDISLKNQLEITISNHSDGEHTFHTEQSFEISKDRDCFDYDDDWDDWNDWDDHDDWGDWKNKDWKDKDWEDKENQEDWKDWGNKDRGDEDEDRESWAISDRTDANISNDFSSTTITLISAEATTTINITAANAPDFKIKKETTNAHIRI